jgi:hypothetical protein
MNFILKRGSEADLVPPVRRLDKVLIQGNYYHIAIARNGVFIKTDNKDVVLTNEELQVVLVEANRIAERFSTGL